MVNKKLLRLMSLFIIEIMVFLPIALSISISNVNVVIETDQATINWKTDVPASGSVKYENTTLRRLSEENSEFTLEHSIKLTGLQSKQMYYFMITSTDSDSRLASPYYNYFTTKDSQAPQKVLNLRSIASDEDSITLSWDVNPEQDIDSYMIVRDGKNIFNQSKEINSYTDNNLAIQSSYFYDVSAVDKSGNIGLVSERLTASTTSPDLTPSIILFVNLITITETQATIECDTDEATIATIHYGETTTVENKQTIPGLILNHTITLTGLVDKKLYYYQCQACDKKNNCVNSSQKSLIAGSDVTPPILTLILPEIWNKPTITINGTTEPLTKIKIFVNENLKRMIYVDNMGNFLISNLNLDTSNEENKIRFEATDFAGNPTIQEVTIKVDVSSPIVNMSAIPDLSPQNSLTINGTVNKEVRVEFWVKVLSKFDSEAPEKIQNLRVTNYTQNSIILEWDKINNTDLSEYGVFRDNIMIATTPSTITHYLDNVDSGTTHIYQIGASDTSCNYGEKSGAITAATTKGGSINNILSRELNYTCRNTIRPAYTTEINNGIFIQTLSLQPGLNEITVKFIDRAGNIAEKKGITMQYSMKPIILKSNIQELTPSYEGAVTIEGKVSENATVAIYVNDNSEPYVGTTDKEGNFSIDIDLEKKIKAEEENGQTSSSTSIEINQGYRNTIRIEATDMVGLKSQPVDGEIVYALCGFGSYWGVNVYGQTPDMLIPRLMINGNAQISLYVNLTWQGGFGNGTIRRANVAVKQPNLKERPDWDYDWVSVMSQFGPQPGEQESRSTANTNGYVLLNIRAIDPTKGNRSKNMTSYEKEEWLAKHRKGECKIPGVGCIRIPLQLEIGFAQQYANDEIGYNPNQDMNPNSQTTQVLTQKQCWTVEIPIDNRIPPKIVPKTFLRETVSGLNATIEMINTVIKPLNTIKKYTFYGCMISWAALYIIAFQKQWSCQAKAFVPGSAFRLEVAQTGTCKYVYGDSAQNCNGAACEACQECTDMTKRYKDYEYYMKWVCDRMFCPAAPTLTSYIKKQKAKAKMPVSIKLADPASGGRQLIVVDTNSDCASAEISTVYMDSSINPDGVYTSREPVNPETNKSQGNYDIKKIAEDYKTFKDNTDCTELHPANPQCCGVEYMNQWDSACVVMNEIEKSKCMSAKAQNDDSGMKDCEGFGSIWDSIADISKKFCAAKNRVQPDIVNTPFTFKASSSAGRVEGTTHTSGPPPGTETTPAAVTPAVTPVAPAAPTVDAASVAPAVTPTVQVVYPLVGQATETETSKTPKGLFISDTPGEKPPAGYFQMEDNDYNLDPCDESLTNFFRYDDDRYAYFSILPADNIDGENKGFKVILGYMLKRKNIELKEAASPADAYANVLDSDIPVTESMVFRPVSASDGTGDGKGDFTKFFVFETDPSGTYSKDKTAQEKQKIGEFQDKLSKCVGFGYDVVDVSSNPGFGKGTGATAGVTALYYKIKSRIGMQEEPYVVDPTSSFLRSVQCVCLPGITSYLNLYKAMMVAVKNCLNTILITGDGSGKMCQAVLTTYVCDLLYDLIKCFAQKYEWGYQREESGGIGNFLAALTGAGADVSRSVSSRYGASSLWKSMFAERQIVHAICLFAFTGKWDFDVNAMLEGDADFPVASQGFIYPCTRRFISFNPTNNGVTTWNYHLGVGLIAGADIQYRVELVCSDTYECDYGNGIEQCDCAKKGKEMTRTIQAGPGVIRKTETVSEEVYDQKQDGVRYDKARLIYTYKNNQNEQVTGEPVVCKIKPEGGPPPAYCSFDLGAGMYKCGINVGKEDFIHFNGDPIPDKNSAYMVNDVIRFNIDMQQGYPQEEGEYDCNQGRCKYTKFLNVVINNGNEDIWSSKTNGGDYAFLSNGNIRQSIQTYVLKEKDFTSSSSTYNCEALTFNGQTRPSNQIDNGAFIVEECSAKKELTAIKLNILSGSDVSNPRIEYSLLESNSFDPDESTGKNRWSGVTPCNGNGGIGTTRDCGPIKIRTTGETKPSGKFIYFKGTVQTTQDGGCDALERPWTAKFTLYDGADYGAGWEPSGQITMYQNNPQTKPVTFKVKCKEDTGGNPGEGSKYCETNTFVQLQGKCICDPIPQMYDCGTGMSSDNQNKLSYCVSSKTSTKCREYPYCKEGENIIPCICDTSKIGDAIDKYDCVYKQDKDASFLGDAVKKDSKYNYCALEVGTRVCKEKPATP